MQRGTPAGGSGAPWRRRPTGRAGGSGRRTIATTVALALALALSGWWVGLAAAQAAAGTSSAAPDLLALTYANGFWVAAGSDGAIYESADASQWSRHPVGATVALRALTYGDGIFVAVGDNGTVATSTDSVLWGIRPSGTTANLRAATTGNGLVLAAGDGGTLLTSTDGVQWTPRITGTTEPLNALTFGNNLFVAVGGGGTILTSTDGLRWTAASSGTTANLEAVTFGNNLFVATGSGGTILTSNDGQHWVAEASGTSADLDTIVYGNNLFLAGGAGGTLLASTSTAQWRVVRPGTANAIRSIVFANNLYVGVGDGGTVLTSGDGAQWSALARGQGINVAAASPVTPPAPGPSSSGSSSPSSPPACPPGTAQGQPFCDTASVPWAEPAIAALASQGIIKGVAPGQFDPASDVTRAQVAALAQRMFQLPAPATPVAVSDVPSSFWAFADVQALLAALQAHASFSLLSGGAFSPNTAMDRQDASAVTVALLAAGGHLQLLGSAQTLAVLAGVPDAGQIDPTLAAYVATGIKAGVMIGFPGGSFQPQAPLTRAQVAVLLYRVQQKFMGSATVAGG
jgi:hypothetical protein